MHLRSNLLKPFLSVGAAFFAVPAIGFFDYISGPEIAFSFFYLIPLALYARSKEAKKPYIVCLSVFAALAWFYCDHSTKLYQNSYAGYWNTLVRLIIFASTSLLIHKVVKNHVLLVEANEKLKAINAEKDHIIGMAAHDIRNPVSAIYSFSEILLSEMRKEVSDEAAEIIQLFHSTSKNMLQLIENLLDVSKIESGYLKLNPQSTNYAELLERQVELQHLMARRKGIALNLEKTSERVFANVDPHYVAEVVDNLVSNAIKYSASNTNITVRLSLKPDGFILTEVIDQGQGIALNEQANLFQYFQRTSSIPTGGEPSTGLGLAIAKKIVVSHGGQIGVKSVPGEGSNFHFTLPSAAFSS